MEGVGRQQCEGMYYEVWYEGRQNEEKRGRKTNDVSLPAMKTMKANETVKSV